MDNTKKPQVVDLVQVITEYKSGNIIVGGKIFMSVEDARGILATTERKPISDEDKQRIVDFESTLPKAAIENKLMLRQCREILRVFAKAVVYANPVETSLGEILDTYQQ